MNEPATQYKDLEEWLSTRPAEIQELARKYPINSICVVKGETMFLVGWREVKDGKPGLICSRIDPYYDYDEATKDCNRVFICSEHLE